jgi:hypothetical protein
MLGLDVLSRAGKRPTGFVIGLPAGQTEAAKLLANSWLGVGGFTLRGKIQKYVLDGKCPVYNPACLLGSWGECPAGILLPA